MLLWLGNSIIRFRPRAANTAIPVYHCHHSNNFTELSSKIQLCVTFILTRRMLLKNVTVF